MNSLITVALNNSQYIEKTIQSVLLQKIPSDYVVIDGGSTDGTVEIINKYKDSISKFISEKDNGIANAFNKGIRLSTGDLIGLVNSGDWLSSSALNRVSQAFADDSVDIVYGDVQYWRGEVPDYRYSANHDLLPSYMSMNHPAVFVRKSVYEKYGYFDERYQYAMDYELMLRFYLAGAKFHYIPEVLSNMSLGGASDKNWRCAYHEVYEIQKKYFGFSIGLYLRYVFRVFKRHVGNIASTLGLEFLKTYYRSRFSKIKKSIH